MIAFESGAPLSYAIQFSPFSFLFKLLVSSIALLQILIFFSVLIKRNLRVTIELTSSIMDNIKQ